MIRPGSIVLVVALLAASSAHAEPVRWGSGYTGIAKELTGPTKTFAAYCKTCKVGDKMAKPPSPYLAVHVTKPETDHGRYMPVLIAIHVKRGWYFRVLGEHGKDYWPHGETRIDQTFAIESITSRDVVAGGPTEIVVVTKTTNHVSGAESVREVWVFTVKGGVVWSLNPIDNLDPASLL
jgi:hypothetical protein